MVGPSRSTCSQNPLRPSGSRYETRRFVFFVDEKEEEADADDLVEGRGVSFSLEPKRSFVRKLHRALRA
jgi:hypothetical protein